MRSTRYMIRKNALFCKLIRIKNSSKSMFDSFMLRFRAELETCPVCNSNGRCRNHAYYGRNIIDFRNGAPAQDNLCITRVFCRSCGHAHAVLPDFIIPYSGYGLFFILRALAEYFMGLHTTVALCERFSISMKQLYKWIALWYEHKEIWLGILENSERSDLSFLKQLCSRPDYSSFSMDFTRKTTHSFLQSHKNPILRNARNARYHQEVFAPDYVFA